MAQEMAIAAPGTNNDMIFFNNVNNINFNDRSSITINYSSGNNTAENSEGASTGDNLTSHNATVEPLLEQDTTSNTLVQVEVNKDGSPVLPPLLIPLKKWI